MSSQGITHHISCAYTPQQNGVAECKDSNLIETASTLFIHHHVPLDPVLTACYLINRMPSNALHHQTPGQNPYSLPLRVFGCTCFVHDLTTRNDKLQLKPIKCVFLGYSRHQKGYKYYDPKTNIYYFSADITSFETSPYFTPNTTSKNLIPQILPVPMLPLPQVNLLNNPQTTHSPLQVYTRRACPLSDNNNTTTLSTDTVVAPDDSFFALFSPAPVMPSSDETTHQLPYVKVYVLLEINNREINA